MVDVHKDMPRYAYVAVGEDNAGKTSFWKKYLQCCSPSHYTAGKPKRVQPFDGLWLCEQLGYRIDGIFNPSSPEETENKICDRIINWQKGHANDRSQTYTNYTKPPFILTSMQVKYTGDILDISHHIETLECLVNHGYEIKFFYIYGCGKSCRDDLISYLTDYGCVYKVFNQPENDDGDRKALSNFAKELQKITLKDSVHLMAHASHNI